MKKNLSRMLADDSQTIIEVEEETLSDGSTVYNVIIRQGSHTIELCPPTNKAFELETDLLTAINKAFK